MRVSIVIPTQRRPEGLERAARSALRQAGVDPGEIELVIADNDGVPSARALAATLALEAPFPVRYVHEPRAGVSHARNAALARAQGALIAFLDDDEEAPEGWLAALLGAQAAFGADVVFGPVRARIPSGIRRHRGYFERFFGRQGPAGRGLIAHHYGCGSSLVRRAALPHPAAPFALERNQTGGEDNLLFTAMRTRGAVFAWAPDAWVWEDPDPARLSLAYTLRRAFAHGQAAALDRADAGDRAGVARWMAIGAVQAALFGLAAAPLWLVGAPARAQMLDRAAQGLGKVFWGGPFRQRFYGLPALLEVHA